MSILYTISQQHFDELQKGVQNFDFIVLHPTLKETPVVITNVKDGAHPDQLVIGVEPIYQVGPDFPTRITVESRLYDWDIDVLTDHTQIQKLLVHYLRTRINLTDRHSRDNALLSAFISTFDV